MTRTNVLFPVVRFRDQTLAPAIRPRDFQPVQNGWSRPDRQWLQAERETPESVDDISQTLPGPDVSAQCQAVSTHIMSANEKVSTFVSPFSALDCLMLTRGWLNAVEGDHGIAAISNIRICR